MKNENLSKIEKVRFAELAFDDLDEILDHVAEFDTEAGNRFIRSLIQKFRLLGENPKIGVAKDELIIGVRLFPFKNYNIFYFEAEIGVEIYRVLHSSRDLIQIFENPIGREN